MIQNWHDAAPLRAMIETLEEAREIIASQSEQITAQEEQIAVLTKAVIMLTGEVEELRAENTKLKTGSKNSSKPPSSDGYRKPSVKNQRVRGGKKPGGQPGRKGITRERTEEPDKVVELKPAAGTCDECGGTIIVEDEAYTIRQIIEALKPQTIVIEYQQYRGICESCGKVFAPELPPGAKGAMGIGNTLRNCSGNKLPICAAYFPQCCVAKSLAHL